MTEFVDVFGDGSDGAYNNGPLVKGRTYNFTTFNLDTAITLGGAGGKIVIKCQGAFVFAASGSITSAANSPIKDSALLNVNGVSYDISSSDGASGAAGVGGATYTRGGTGGLMSMNGASGTNGYSAVGGTGGISNGAGDKNGGIGEQAPNDWNSGGGGGGGAGGYLTAFQNGIAIIVGGPCTLEGSITGNGGTTAGAGAGGRGGEGPFGGGSGGGGGGGGGGAGSGGGGGIRVLVVTAKAVANNLSLTATPSAGGAGGGAGAGGGGRYSEDYGVAGTAGTAGASGTAGTITTAQAATGAQINDTVVTNIFAERATAASAIINDGGSEITERGFVYSQSANPVA